MFNRLISLILVSTFFISTAIQANDWDELSSLLPKGTQSSYIIKDADSNKIIATHNAETLRTPASMQKLLTATAAKLYLGDDFKYQTKIIGQKSKIKEGVYKGDLRFLFVGDPLLLRTDITAMLIKLKKQGIKIIEGDFYLNESHFNGYQWSNGQAWNDLGVCFTSPSNAIIVNKNCIKGNLSLENKDAKKARLFIPNYDPVEISADVDVVTKAQRLDTFCALEVTRNSQNRYQLWGCMVPRTRPLPLAFAVNDPFEYTKKIIAAELNNVGIELAGKIKSEKIAFDEKGSLTFALHQSPPLTELLSIMMKKSDNLIADSLFKTLGGAYFNRPGNFRNGSIAVKNILKDNGIDIENAYLADGSGLSRHNLMSAELFMSVLEYVYYHDNKLNLLHNFSIAGVDGTLKHHKGVKGKEFKGRIIAKTGSMNGVANLLGVAKTDHGNRLFVIIINGYNLPQEQYKSPLPRDEKASKYLFEQAFFKQAFEK